MLLTERNAALQLASTNDLTNLALISDTKINEFDQAIKFGGLVTTP